MVDDEQATRGWGWGGLSLVVGFIIYLLIGLYFVGPRWELPNWCEGAQAQDDGGVSRF